MTLTIDLHPDQHRQLTELAGRAGLTLEQLARRELAELLERQEAVRSASAYVLKKNAELYRRLAK